jgi:hypothetical protein
MWSGENPLWAPSTCVCTQPRVRGACGAVRRAALPRAPRQIFPLQVGAAPSLWRGRARAYPSSPLRPELFCRQGLVLQIAERGAGVTLPRLLGQSGCRRAHGIQPSPGFHLFHRRDGRGQGVLTRSHTLTHSLSHTFLRSLRI